MRRSPVALAVTLIAGAAWAHAFLDRAVPSVGAVLTGSPSAVRLYFTEPIEPLFSGVEVTTAAGSPVTTGAASVDPQNPAALVLPLPPLMPGRYRVKWHAVSVDSHRTEGSYEFELRP
jgi:copper resistance protein C